LAWRQDIIKIVISSNFFVDGYHIQYYTCFVNRKKTFKDRVPVSILIPAALQKAIQAKATREGRSFSAEVRQAIKKEMAKEVA
jgi:hypothetical protein